MAQSSVPSIQPFGKKQKPYLIRLGKNIVQNRWVYAMIVPILAYYILFHYFPLYGVQIAFRDYNPSLGFWGSKWVGMRHFISFFSGMYAWRTIRNTLFINFYNLIFGFPAPIILALLLEEIKATKFKRITQTITYLPHFISTVVITGIMLEFLSTNGLFNQLISAVNPAHVAGPLNAKPALFRRIYVMSDIWQGVGWGSIIFLAALSGVDQELYEAVMIDGGNRFHRVVHVSIPSILPTIMIMLILRIGSMMGLGFEKIILLYQEATYETADVISSYVYRRGLEQFAYSFSSAVGLFNNVVNFILVNIANYMSRKFTETSLW